MPVAGDAGIADPRPRVLLLIKGLGLGGAERLLVDVVAARDRERFDYEVAYVLAGQDALVPAMEATGVPVHDLGGSASADLRWTAALRRLLVRGHFDVLHSHLPYTAALGRLVALTLPRRSRPVLVYTEHSLWNKAAVVTKAFNRATVGVDRALIVVSVAARDALPLALRSRARVVVHGVDRTRFTPLLEQRTALRRAVRAELGADRRRGAGAHGRQPAQREGLRRPARGGPPDRGGGAHRSGSSRWGAVPF